jgi:hypothetical protein
MLYYATWITIVCPEESVFCETVYFDICFNFCHDSFRRLGYPLQLVNPHSPTEIRSPATEVSFAQSAKQPHIGTPVTAPRHTAPPREYLFQAPAAISNKTAALA